MAESENSSAELIRERAYALWEQDGRPEGRSELYWERAMHEIKSPAKPPEVQPSTQSAVAAD